MIKRRTYVRLCDAFASLVWALVIVFSTVQDVDALQIELGAGAGLDYSSNIQLTPDNEEEELIGIGEIGFSLQEDSGSVRADIASALRYEDFINNTFDNQFLFTLAGQAEWRIVPERLSWLVEDRFRQLPVDSLDPATPDNRQDTNVLSTGPNITLRFGQVHQLELGARYTDVYFEISESNSKRYSTSATWLYTPISTRDIYLNVDIEKVDFDNQDINGNFTREDYSLTVLQRYARSEFEAQVGGTSIQREDQDFNGPLFRLTWKWTPTRVSTIELRAATELTDAGRNLQAIASDLSQDTIQTEQASPDVFREKRADLAYVRSGTALRGRVRPFWIERDYSTLPLDRTIKGIATEINYNLTARLIGGIRVDYGRTQEFATERVDNDFLAAAGFNYIVRRDLLMEISAGLFKRNSNMSENNYDELRGLIGLIYRIDAFPGETFFSERSLLSR